MKHIATTFAFATILLYVATGAQNAVDPSKVHAPDPKNANPSVRGHIPDPKIYPRIVSNGNLLFCVDASIGQSAATAAAQVLLGAPYSWTVEVYNDLDQCGQALDIAGVNQYNAVVWAMQGSFSDTAPQHLVNFVNIKLGSTQVVIQDFSLPFFESRYADLGITGNEFTDRNFVSFSISDPTLSSLIASPQILQDPGWGTYSYTTVPGAQWTVLATTQNGNTAIASRNNGQIYFNGFLDDTFVDFSAGTELYLWELTYQDPCAEVTCDTPGTCQDLPGTCLEGDCLYTTSADDTPCTTGAGQPGVCQGGACNDPCAEVTCDTPGNCQDSPGTCSQGTCSYTTSADDTPCTIGTGQPGVCQGGACNVQCCRGAYNSEGTCIACRAGTYQPVYNPSASLGDSACITCDLSRPNSDPASVWPEQCHENACPPGSRYLLYCGAPCTAGTADCSCLFNFDCLPFRPPGTTDYGECVQATSWRRLQVRKVR